MSIKSIVSCSECNEVLFFDITNKDWRCVNVNCGDESVYDNNDIINMIADNVDIETLKYELDMLKKFYYVNVYWKQDFIYLRMILKAIEVYNETI